MRTTATQFSRIRTRLSDGITLLNVRAPSPSALMLALILGPALLKALRSI